MDDEYSFIYNTVPSWLLVISCNLEQVFSELHIIFAFVTLSKLITNSRHVASPLHWILKLSTPNNVIFIPWHAWRFSHIISIDDVVESIFICIDSEFVSDII